MAAKTTPTKSTKDAADTAAARAIAPSPEWNRAMPPVRRLGSSSTRTRRLTITITSLHLKKNLWSRWRGSKQGD